MNNINTKQLLNDFPEFFKHREDPMTSLMAFGFECADGWHQLIHDLCEDINDHYRGDIPTDFYVVQVKEKYGSLRFYTTGTTQEVLDLIHKAELASYSICEDCGQPGQYRDKLGYIQTLCDTCLDKYYMKLYSRIRNPHDDYISEWQKENGAPYKEG